MTVVYTKHGVDVFDGYDSGDSPRQIATGEAQVWASEVEAAIDAVQADADANAGAIAALQADIGAVTSPFVPSGAYSGATSYSRNDLVTDQGSTWLYVYANPTSGHAPPTLPTTSNTWWQLFAEQGSDGASDIGAAYAALGRAIVAERFLPGGYSINLPFIPEFDPPSFVTFTRSGSIGYCVGPDGYLRNTSANKIRHHYDPATGRYRGALLEGAVTNLLLYSQDHTQSAWTKGAATVSAGAATAPDGAAASADKIVESTANSTHQIRQIVTVTVAQKFARSVWVKAAGRSACEVRVRDADSTSNYFYARFDLATGTVKTSGVAGNGVVYGTPKIKAYRNGWYRVKVAGKANTSGTRIESIVYLSNDDGTTTSYTGDGSSGLYVWGHMQQTGQKITSYVPTTAATATRNADTFDITLAGRFNSAEITLYVEAQVDELSDGNENLLTLSDGTANERLSLRSDASANLQLAATAGGVSQAQLGTVTQAADVAFRIAARAKADSFAVSVDGADVETDTSGTMPAVTTLSLGRRPDATAEPFNGTVLHLMIGNTGFSDADVPALAA